MTGPEHYLEAERLLDYVNQHSDTLTVADAQSFVAEAQVHATLALTTSEVQAEAREVAAYRS